jgi:hypothetical protein
MSQTSLSLFEQTHLGLSLHMLALHRCPLFQPRLLGFVGQVGVERLESGFL